MSGGNEAVSGMSADAIMAAAHCQPTRCTLTAGHRYGCETYNVGLRHSGGKIAGKLGGSKRGKDLYKEVGLPRCGLSSAGRALKGKPEREFSLPSRRLK